MKEGISLEELLIAHEKKVPHAYQDSRGFWTIGIGRCIDRRVGGGLSHDEMHYLLRNDIDKCRRYLQKMELYRKIDSPIRRDALVEMVFNLGWRDFLDFHKMLAALNNGDYRRAALEALDSKWSTQVGKRALDIAYRIEHGEMPK